MSGAAMQGAVHVDVRRISQHFRSGRGADLLALDRIDLQARRGAVLPHICRYPNA
jgi:NitT/TauT family transport system ATP-binding protein